MGAGASTSGDVNAAEQYDQAYVETLTGVHFDPAVWKSKNVDGKVSGVVLLEVIAEIKKTFNLELGDVVKAQPDGESLYCEGVVNEVKGDGVYEINFGEDDSEDIPRHRIQKVRQWNALEVGDRVKVKDGALMFEATITAVDITEETYTVRFDGEDGEEPDTEAGVKDERIIKIGSCRISVEARWKQIRAAVKVIGMGKRMGVAEDPAAQPKPDTEEAKEDKKDAKDAKDDVKGDDAK